MRDETCRDAFRLDAALGAVTAANVGNNHAHRAERQTEDAREFLSHRKRALGRAPHVEDIAFELRHADVRLHRIVLCAGKIKTVFEDLIGILKPMFDIAALVAKMETNIALIVNDVLAAPAIAGIFAVFELLVHQRSAGFQRVFKREYRGKFIVLDLDQFHRVCGDAGIRGGDRGNHVTDVTNFFTGDDLLVSDVSAKGIAGKIQIVAGQNSEHTRQRPRLD